MKPSSLKKLTEQCEGVDSWQRENFLDDQITVHTISRREDLSSAKPLTDAQVQFQMRAHALAQAENQSRSGDSKKPWAYTQSQIQQKVENQFQHQQALKKEADPVPFKVVHEERVTLKVDKTENKVLSIEPRTQLSAGGPSYFLRAADNAALYGLGSSFYEDMKRGKRHFSFANLHSGDDQKKTVLGVASFIQHFERLDILVITPGMDNTFFGRFKTGNMKREKAITASPAYRYTTYQHQGITFLEWDEILLRCSSDEKVSVDSMIQALVADYDIVLYDLPEVNEGKKKFEVLISLLQIMQSVSLVVNLQEDTFSAVSELKRYFQNYKVSVKGLITSRPNHKMEL